ncbi:N-acyl-L-homoserine lactone synthetase [Roseobacter sp. HKCCD9010]|jgi:N-acyl-L-homoserine lactone synthetase|uniref:acyl-homoserine-lactone synthase n=1 Tax=Rhodobacterales TaxID=204455 RepID=UPI00119A233B|nr:MULTISPECIES: acyl-homoserine-lactone synthase [Rhodobacterales]MBF9051672.1 N-acyl-L-homoserine lactone synthetase [Rhodobacterales bacterium HKCCD4356]NNV13196.1 N-acyl-L-homoserine lactone synthetase [Roseobacter sp. HKCCD7357]NNV17447.1 N-acyl-L-homoserine lactone synthetase [Roseobacter sp. HKCCD8768]NNV27053.1 N-acyl-L-homoserine lactone synthetase [Roseobacter sp. HKCCD8192]NNV31173.1 N-acyl-L-homoserine lactone synthetase [Roseobacter sp. HKCCD9061]
MQSTTLSFDNIHNHGDLFTNMLRARHNKFIEHMHWDLPNADGMEFDQYDTPQSRWVCVHENGKVLAGVRLTPTTARCGIYSYMVRDAQRGLLEEIPSNLLDDPAPIAAHIWDANRLFVAEGVSTDIRRDVQMSLMGHMVRSARALGATMLLGLLPIGIPRLGRRLGISMEPGGPIMKIGGVAHRCYFVSMASKMH